MKNVLILISLLLCSILNAQIIEDETAVLDKPNGEPLFKLNAGLGVYSYDPEEGWFKIRREAWVMPSDLPDEKYLYPGTVLKDEDGKKIGEVLKEVKIRDKRKLEGYRGDNRVIVVLEGYVFKTKIKDGSLPEERINELLAEKSRPVQTAGFQELFELYDFEEKDFDEFTAYAMREEHKTAATEQDFRVIIIFRGETSVFAVITNDHQITAPKIKDEYDDPPFHILYLYKPSSAQKDLIENTILYTFLSL